MSGDRLVTRGSIRGRSDRGPGTHMSVTPIADYALLSDRHSAALVSRDGSIDWLCFPRFDSSSIFGRLLGDAAGYWAIRAAGATQVTRRYLDRTMVLETTSRTPTGAVVIVEALAMGDGNRGHELGNGAPHLLLRRATCIEGEVELHLEYVPRPEYGLVHPLFDAVDGGLTASAGDDVLVISSPMLLTVEKSSVSGRLQLRRDESAGFALHHATRADAGTARTLEPIRDQRPVGRHRVGVGVVVGAPPGLRGSVAGHGAPQRTGAAGALLRARPARSARRPPLRCPRWWAEPETGTTATRGSATLPSRSKRCGWRPARTRPMSSSTTWRLPRPARSTAAETCRSCSASAGERDLPERELPHLEGWRHSAPVRVGNGAASQRQLDVYGELLSAVYRLSDHLFDVARRVGPSGRSGQVGCADQSRAGHPKVPRRAGRHRGPPVAGEGPRDLGGSGRASPLLVLEAHVLGGPRPGGRVGRRARRFQPRRDMEADRRTKSARRS